MFSSPLLRPARTWLPERWRRRAGRALSGPPGGEIKRTFRAAIFQLDRLGDFVLTLSVVRTLLEAWGEAECLLVVSTAAAPLAALEFPRTPRLVLPAAAPSLTRNLVPAWWRERRQLRGLACRELVCLSHHRDLYKDVALTWLATGRTHALHRATYPTERSDAWCLEIVAHRQLAGAALGRTLTVEETTPRFTQVAVHDGSGLVVCPFASEPVRRLPESLLLESLDLWRTRSGAPVVLSGVTRDAAALDRLAQLIHARWPGGRIEVAAADRFTDFLARIAGAGAVLATESGPGHLATALDKRAVIAVGGGTHGLCVPWRRSARQFIAEHQTPCYHCGGSCHQPGVPCLSQISPTTIANALPAL